MSLYGDSLAAFGNAQIVEVPPALIASPYGGIANTNDATAKNPLGTLYRYKGNMYRYVKFDNGSGNVASAAYGVAHWKTLSPSTGVFTVTSDYTDAIGTINTIAGIFQCAVTDAYYTWIQVGGVALVTCNSSQVAGDIGIGSSSDLTFGRIAADATITSVPYGVAIEAYGTTTNTEAKHLLHNCLESF